MKKLFTLSLLMIAIRFASTAQITNGDFENWTAAGAYSDPDSFHTTNQYTALASVFMVNKTTDKYHGSFAADLTTTHIVVTGFIDGVYPGIITNGNLNASFASGVGSPIINGKPIHYKPTDFSFYYKYNGAGGDSCKVNMYLTKWNASLGKRDTISKVEWWNSTFHSTYTLATTHLTYVGTGIPDTMQIMMASSGFDTSYIHAGSDFKVDSMTFYPLAPAGIFEAPTNLIEVSVAPNPTHDAVNFQISEANREMDLQIFDLNGQLIYNNKMRKTLAVNTAKWATGTYIYVLKTNETKMATGKLEVVH